MTLADDLYGRYFALNLGGTRIASQTVEGEANELLKCIFKIELSLSKSPNTAEITVYNLAETTRAKLAEKDVLTELEAGYLGLHSLIFKGKLEAGVSRKDGVDWITTIQSTDGGKELRSGRINVSFKKVSFAAAFERIADALGVQAGNSIEKMKAGNIRGALEDFANGTVLSGAARKELDRFTRTYGLKWSIQAGQLQLLGPTDTLDASSQAILLDNEHGMIGTPQAGEKGIIEASSLLNPHMTPGRLVSLKSTFATGFYRIEKTVFDGDTRGKNWYANLELKPL